MSWELKMARAIKIINSNAVWRSEGTSWDDVVIEWLEGTTAISDSDIDAKVTELTTKNAHILPRSKAYPDLEEQLDFLWHAIDADADLKTKLAGFYNAIKTVKDANPKP